MQPAVGVHSHRQPFVLLHVRGLGSLLDELQQALDPHDAAEWGEKNGANQSRVPCALDRHSRCSLAGRQLSSHTGRWAARSSRGYLHASRLGAASLVAGRRCPGSVARMRRERDRGGTRRPGPGSPGPRWGSRGSSGSARPSRGARRPPRGFQAARAERGGPAPRAGTTIPMVPRAALPELRRWERAFLRAFLTARVWRTRLAGARESVTFISVNVKYQQKSKGPQSCNRTVGWRAGLWRVTGCQGPSEGRM